MKYHIRLTLNIPLYPCQGWFCAFFLFFYKYLFDWIHVRGMMRMKFPVHTRYPNMEASNHSTRLRANEFLLLSKETRVKWMSSYINKCSNSYRILWKYICTTSFHKSLFHYHLENIMIITLTKKMCVAFDFPAGFFNFI